MDLLKVQIQNFKSIENIELEIKKYGESYTTMFVGINESGKSNILQAMSFFNVPLGEYNYLDYCNQKKQDEARYVNVYFYLNFKNKYTYLEIIKEGIENGDILDFEIDNIEKNIYLKKGENFFGTLISFELKNFPKNLFIKSDSKEENVDGVAKTVEYFKLSEENDLEGSFDELTEELFRKYFEKKILNIIKIYEPKITFWKATEEYLIEKKDLNDFSKDIDSNKALRNIFLLAGYDTNQKIQEAVRDIPNSRQKSILQSRLNDELDKYIKKVWKHNIDIVIEITETAQFSLLIKDKGETNKHDRLPIGGRSEGARHFLSLILSLSIENNKGKRKNQLILIDEPESHLHPSGIRDLKEELLKIGKENYVFVATHSPFLIDKQNKERNIIIMKNNQAITEKRQLKGHENIIDDEVLREAFGLEVYRDLLNPHSILVEGMSDKVILQKAFEAKDLKEYGITNGHGSNIDTLAAKLNDTGISILVVLDDDEEGKRDKSRIIKLGSCYSKKNVFTIRDLVGEIKDGGSIEDVLGLSFIDSQFKKFYKSYFGENCDIVLEDDTPFISQIKMFLYKNKNYEDIVIDKFKIKISEDLELPKTDDKFLEKFPLLFSLVDKIRENNII